MTKKQIDEVFFLLFCQKNSDGTKHLHLRGRELFQRIGRRLNEEDMYPLVAFLHQHPEVISIDLAYNDLNDEGVRILAQEYFEKENNLLFINLMHCDMHAEGLKWLSSAKHLNLHKIWLTGNKLGAVGARFIGVLIEQCKSLEILDIGETDQTLESIESLLMVIEKSRLKSLNISRIIPNSYYSRYNNSTLADDLSVLLKLNYTLEVLRVQKCEFDGHDVELLFGGLDAHKQLTMLDLSANRIGDHGVELLAVWLRSRPALIVLRIASNEIFTPGAEALGLNLPFSRVRLLDISNNSIGDQGLADIFDSLKKSTQMRQLFIWGNVLGDISLAKLERLLASGTLKQEDIDVQIYHVDGKRCAACTYSTNNFKHLSYAVQDYGIPQELRIVRKKVWPPNAQPRALIDFNFIDRYPPVNERLGLKVAKVEDDAHKYLPNKNEKNSQC